MSRVIDYLSIVIIFNEEVSDIIRFIIELKDI